MKPQPSLKDIAAETGLSVSTISLALRGSPKIPESTAKVAREAAARLGYIQSPLIAALMTRVRGSSPTHDHTTLAVIDLSPSCSPATGPLYYREVYQGVRSRAEHLGFRTDVFHLFQSGMTAARLDAILANRGITGAIVPPFVGDTEILPLRLDSLSTVLIGYSISMPLHRTTPDQFQGMMLAMDRLRSLGYRRIGLVLDAFTDRRVGHKWTAAHGWHRTLGLTCPQLSAPEISGGDLINWIRAEKPDVILSPRPEHLRAIREAGIAVPEQIGFCLLNYDDHLEPCTAINQRGKELGAAAVDTLAAQLYSYERGVPAAPKTVMIVPVWVDGPTTRQVGA